MINPNFFQKINYPKHPGFSKVRVNVGYDQDKIYELIRKIDGKVSYLKELSPLKTFSLGLQFHEATKNEIRAIEDAFTHGAPSAPIRELGSKVLSSAVDWAMEELDFFGVARQRCLFREVQGMDRAEVKTSMNAFLEDGFARIDLGDEARDLFRCHHEGFLQDRRKHYAGQKDWRGAKGLDLKKGFGAQLKRILQERGVTDLLSFYKREKMVLYYIGLDYSHERQLWYRDCYADSGLPTAKTTYAHFDAGQAIPKMMAYLSDVTEETGPFTVVRQSNLVEKSFFLGHLHAAMDRVVWSAVEKPADDTYYRPPFKHHRDVFLSFPMAFQGTTHFGDDLADGSEGSNELLKYMEPIVGPSGTACVFDGYRTIHSGGLVRRGERLALQIGFQPARNVPTRWQKYQKKISKIFGKN